MKFTAPLLLLLVVLLCGFTGSVQQPSFGPGEPAPKLDRMDVTQSTIDMYLNGTQKAMYWVTVHENPEAGQYWETVSDLNGMKMTNRWNVAKVDGDTAIIECEFKMDSEYMVSDYVLGYKVDLTVEMGKANVTKAWIAKPGDEGQEVKVMEMPESNDADDGEPEFESKTEDFADMELAGGKWSGKVTTTTYDGTESKVWMADNGWFGGMIKMQSGDYVVALSAFGTDGKALLKWKEEKEDKADEPKDPETGDKPDGEKDGNKDEGNKDEGKKEEDKKD